MVTPTIVHQDGGVKGATSMIVVCKSKMLYMDFFKKYEHC